ncbi:MAG: DUF21 domain-containing protein [Fibrobacteria bacterium]|nr:DUF21 domain-containing protein [Fibrobacteria bacterium]
MILELISLTSLILLSGFFSSTETALFSFSKTDCLSLQKSNSIWMQKTASLLKHPEQALTSLLLGNNMVNILLVLVAGRILNRFPFLTDAWGLSGPLLIITKILLIASFTLFFGEILPKSFALKQPLLIIRITIFPFSVFHNTIDKLKIRYFMTSIANSIISAVRNIYGDKEEGATHADIQVAAELGEKEGHISKEESKLISRVLELKHISLSKIMLHRSFVKTVRPQDTVSHAVHLGLNTHFFSIPVYNRKTDKIDGIFNVNEALLSSQKGIVAESMHSPKFIPEVNASETLLQILMDKNWPNEDIMIIIDEFGTYSGVISKKDIISFLFDTDSGLDNLSESGVSVTPEGFMINADVRTDVLERILKSKLIRGDFVTVGGMIMDITGSIPKKGDWVVIKGWKFYIDEAEQNRINKIFIKRKGAPL